MSEESEMGGLGRMSAARPARMEPLARLPVFFALAGRRVVLVGGSEGAAWKAELLAAAGAIVEVFASDPSDEMRNVAAEPPAGAIHLHERPWRKDDLDGAILAIGAIEDEDEAASFAAACRARGVVVNVVDKPAFCDFSFGSIVNRSPLVVGISSDGGAPALTQAIRVRIEALLPKGLQRWAEAAKRWRSAITAASGAMRVRRRLWETFARLALDQAGREPRDADLAEILARAEQQVEEAARGEVVLVGAGPGDPDLLTLKAVRALQAADVILYDNLVSRGV